MTKQEFAIKLLFWLMPWPLSKAFPRILIRILQGPAAQTPLQWAQATYDALAKYLSDATAYAATLMATIDDITPTDQLIQAAAALTAALENATSLLATLTAIMDHLGDYTAEQIWQAFMHTITAMGDLTSAIDALIAAIEQIPAEDRPEIPPPVYMPPEEPPEVPPEEIPEIPPVEELPPEIAPPEEIPELPAKPPPLYIPPFPPLYPGMPGQGLSAPVYLPQKPRPRVVWVVYFDNTYWSPLATNFSWDGTKWVANPATWFPKITHKGIWAHGYRPTKARVTITGPTDYMRFADSANFPIYINNSYISGTEVDLDWTDQDGHVMTDIYSLTVGSTPSDTRTITNIEFFED